MFGETLSLLTLQEETTSTKIKINHPPDVEVCWQIYDISALLPSQWRAALQLNTDLATPTAERSGLAWTSALPSLLHTPPGIRPWPQGTSLILSLSTYSLSALCPLSLAAWVILSFRNCLCAVTGKPFLWRSKRRWIDHTVTLASLSCSKDAYRDARTMRHKKQQVRQEGEQKTIYKILNPVWKHSLENMSFNCWWWGEKW